MDDDRDRVAIARIFYGGLLIGVLFPLHCPRHGRDRGHPLAAAALADPHHVRRPARGRGGAGAVVSGV